LPASSSGRRRERGDRTRGALVAFTSSSAVPSREQSLLAS
jgi:hypothetical protein